MLTDEQWAVLEPLIDACRPHAKRPSPELRRTLSAILWRHQNGVKRRRPFRSAAFFIGEGVIWANERLSRRNPRCSRERARL